MDSSHRNKKRYQTPYFDQVTGHQDHSNSHAQTVDPMQLYWKTDGHFSEVKNLMVHQVDPIHVVMVEVDVERIQHHGLTHAESMATKDDE